MPRCHPQGIAKQCQLDHLQSYGPCASPLCYRHTFWGRLGKNTICRPHFQILIWSRCGIPHLFSWMEYSQRYQEVCELSSQFLPPKDLATSLQTSPAPQGRQTSHGFCWPLYTKPLVPWINLHVWCCWHQSHLRSRLCINALQCSCLHTRIATVRPPPTVLVANGTNVQH